MGFFLEISWISGNRWLPVGSMNSVDCFLEPHTCWIRRVYVADPFGPQIHFIHKHYPQILLPN